MFSISPAEILTIAVIALLVFGPKRLPEIARRAGKILRDLRGAADELKTGLESEYREIVEPVQDLRDSMQEAITGASAVNPEAAAEPVAEADEESDDEEPA